MPRFRGLAMLVAGLTFVAAGQLSVAAQTAGLDSTVYRGTCDRLGDPVSDPTPFFFGVGDYRGNAQAVPAASSYAQISVPMDTLLADDHAVTASENGGDIVACGEIAGTRTDDGALMFGLRAEKGSGITGVAYVVPLEDPLQTEVSVLAAGESLAEIASAQAEAATAYADDMVRIADSMRESFYDFVLLTGDARVDDDDWMSEVEAQVAIWDSHYEEALTLNPPSVFAETHGLLVDALRLYVEAGDGFLAAFDARDRTLLNQAFSTVAQADELFVQVVAEVDRIREERGE